MFTSGKRNASGRTPRTPLPFCFWFHRDTSALTRSLWRPSLGGMGRVLKAQGPLFPLPYGQGRVSESTMAGGSKLPPCLTALAVMHGAVAATRQDEHRATFSWRRHVWHLHKEGFQAWHLEAPCLHRFCCLFCSAVAGKGRDTQRADHSLQHPWEHLKTSLMGINVLRSFWSFLRCFSISSSAFFLLSRPEVQCLLGIYLKWPPQRNGSFSSLHSDVRDNAICQIPKLSFRMKKCSATEECYWDL